MQLIPLKNSFLDTVQKKYETKKVTILVSLYGKVLTRNKMTYKKP